MLRLYARIQASKYNASAYYRTFLPFTFMAKMGFPVAPFIDWGEADYSINDRWQFLGASDIVWAYQLIEENFPRYINETRGWGSLGRDNNGEERFPPSFVACTDDDLFNVTPLNGAFGRLGYKGPNGNELKPGDRVNILGTDGQPMMLWQNTDPTMEKFTDYAQNKKLVGAWRDSMMLSELTIVSTQGCADAVIREGLDPKKVHIFPNCVDIAEYPQVALDRPKDRIKILFQGSTTHHEDLWPLRDAFGKLARKYKNIDWTFWGINYSWVADYLPKENVTFSPWVDYRGYGSRLATIGHHINIAPLSPTTFNQSRSAIKWYESSAVYHPAATVAQKTGAYPREIQHGETGMLFETPEQFYDCVAELIEDPTKRETMASNAKDWVLENRRPEDHVKVLHDKLVEVREARKLWPVPRAAKRRVAKARKKEVKRVSKKQPHARKRKKPNR